MKKQHKHWLKVLCIAGICSTIDSSAIAGGFQLNEYSSAGLGRSYAGDGAIADGVDSASRNPATIMHFQHTGMSIGTIFVDPNIDVSGQTSTGNSLDIHNVAPISWVPNLHLVIPINTQFGVGASLTSNYGLGTEYNSDYLAGEIAGTTSLISVNANISGAWRLSPHFSLGLGLNATYGQAKIIRYSGIALQHAIPSLPTGLPIIHLTGDGWGDGWNAGLLYEFNQNNRYSLAYRSKMELKFHGDYSSILPTVMNQPATGTDGKTLHGTLVLNLPETWEISGYNKMTPQWAIHYSAMLTRWSRFHNLNATDSTGSTLFFQDESFHDTWRLALGGSYDLNDNWTLRAGIAFDQNPAPAKTRTISTPNQNRWWFSSGISYAFTTSSSIDAGISLMRGQTLTFNDGAYHNLQVHASAWLFGLNYNYLF